MEKPKAGDKFGMLTLLSKERNKWLCQCECGETSLVTEDHLKTGHTRSCGCLKSPNLVGRQFGRLTVIERAENYKKDNGTYRRWLCQCECGNYSVHLASVLLRGEVNSCGCLAKEVTSEVHTKHGESDSLLYRRWSRMKNRCKENDQTHRNRYFDRGICVCEEWKKDFGAFRDWALANGYRPELTIDRIDFDKGYSPDNCRWIPAKEQHRNTCRNIYYEYQGEKLIIPEIAEKVGLQESTLRSRLNRGWSLEKATTTPNKRREQH